METNIWFPWLIETNSSPQYIKSDERVKYFFIQSNSIIVTEMAD